MKTLKFSILVEAIDSYIYSGHLFIILKNGDIAFTPFSRIIFNLTRAYPAYENLFKLSFQRNDYLTNTQGMIMLGIGELKTSLVDLWEKASEEIQFVMEFELEDFKVISKVPTMPVLDLRLYAMRMYIGSKEGLYEVNLNPQDDRYTLKPSKPEKRFDAKVTCLNASSGEIIISCNNEGLYHGSFLNADNKLKVINKPVAQKSLRTGWSSYDVINYQEQNNFDYLVNKTEKADSKPAYSKFDETRERKKISQFGVSHYELKELLSPHSELDPNEISYCFNSSTKGFFFLKDGRFVNVNINKNSEKDHIYFTSRTYDLPTLNGLSNLKKPISTSIVPNGCVVEYFDKVVLYQNSKAKVIETSPSISVRTYLPSLRYRNLISVTKFKEISIHSIFPFDEKPIPLTMEIPN